MGEKGARQSAAGAQAVQDLLADLAPLGELRAKKMFGGFGVFADDVMFAIIDSSGCSFLRADDTTRDQFEANHSTQHGRMPYWTVPAQIRADPVALHRWAVTALAVARSASAQRPRH